MDLHVKSRDILGPKVNKLRKEGLIPAELYGHGIKNLHLTVPVNDFEHVYDEAGESMVVNLVLDSEGKDKRPVMIHEVSLNPVTDEVLSVDFYQVRLDEKITVYVPVEFVGVSPAVKDKGGVLVKALQEFEIEALPNDVPHEISVDISKINEIGESIHVNELSISDKVKALLDGETVVATVTEKMTEEEESKAEEEVDVEAVKTETEGQKEKSPEKEAVSKEAE